ncbi:alpha/beta hydrolase family protein [Sphingomonas sp. DT-204]|uniref:alpha/beta hydrolase family protein n=1 Tax=Sphingomonas sp. DT-204 TaxID=3396166 RepID=UPI003F1C73FA
MRKLLGCFAIAAAMAMPIVARAADDAAVRFGARDNVLDVSISPDGKSLVILQPNGARGTMASVVRLDGNGPPAMKGILYASGSPERLTFCRWSTNDRLICGLYLIDAVYGKKRAGTRLLSVNSDGSEQKALTARGNDRSLGIALGGGEVIDWQGDNEDGSVLMSRWYIPETTTGHIISSEREGYGVERVNTRTLARRIVETPNKLAVEYITDGHANVRMMGLAPRNTVGQSTSLVEYRYRRKGSREWLPFGTVTYSNYHATGFVPYAVDPDLDVVYGLETVNGRTGLYKVALDGSLRKELVFDRPDAGIDELLTIGRQNRVVGASWVTDKRKVAMFDPELSRFSAALSKALPGAPLVNIVDASADEQKLVVFASSDTDPGRFYLYDKASKHLAEILPVRPLLAQTKLATVKPITYPAGDGTMVPAYLTLPPGSDGKNLPAIVLPHGGPTYRDEWNFDWLPQYFTSRGYAVVQPNYRGSSGYGMEWFQQNGIRSWRTAIGDIDDAGRWLVKSGIADPSKLAIVGWSYGGYAALQSAVVDPALFKAIVAIAPVTDFGIVREQEERDGGETPETLDAIFGDAATAQEGSPARHADRFVAPVLLFHGDVDQNVAIGQSRLMQDRLKDAGKKAELIEYKGLDHQLDDNAARAHMLDRADKFLRASMGM